MAQSRYELSPMNEPADNDRARRPPKDKFNIVWIVLLLHGIGTLMPWNMFINAEDYFRKYKLNETSLLPPSNVSSSSPGSINQPTVTDPALIDYRDNFLVYIGVAAQLPSVLFNALNLLVDIGSGNLKSRVNLTLVIETIIFIFTIVLAVLDTSQWTIQFFYLTMVSVVILNMSNGIYQNCIFGTGAKFPSSYTNAVLIGSNFSGTFTSCVRILSLWLAPKPQEAAIYYFVTALFILLVCIISYNLLSFNAYFKYCDQKQMEVPAIETSRNWVPEDITSDVALSAMNNNPKKPQESRNGFMQNLKYTWKVFLQCWGQCLNVFFTFFITLILFPNILADIKSVEEESTRLISDNYFTPVACFLTFNLFAMIGNLVSSFTTWPGKKYTWVLVILRFALVPFFLFCNLKSDKRKWPIYINNDYGYIFGNVVMAFSSGYLSSLCMIFASKDLAPRDAQKAGMIAAFFLIFGIFIGISSSSYLVKVVELTI